PLRPDGEVEAVTAGLEIGQGGAHTDAVDVVLRPQADARGLRVMHVRVLGKVSRDTGAIKGLLHGRPGGTGKAAYRDGAVRAVKRIAEIGIVLQFLERG